MTTVWVKNSGWETKPRYHWEQKAEAFSELLHLPSPPYASLLLRIPSFPKVFAGLQSPRCRAIQGPSSQLWEIHTVFSSRVTVPTNISEVLELLSAKNSFSCALPTGWEGKMKMLLLSQFCEDPASSHRSHSPTMGLRGIQDREKELIFQVGFAGGKRIHLA